MAFLDNSGDILLDAVLTEDGRKLMAQGQFQISKFALGDDEINYGLYDTAHPSGSAYYDLEILQTPIFEASTAINAGINYGLLSITNPNLLYLTAIKENKKVSAGILRRDNVYYLAYDDGTTYDALVSGFGGKGAGDRLVLNSSNVSQKQGIGNGILLETGLDTNQLAATQQNKSQFISGQGLSDSSFKVFVDSRLINVVYGPSASDKFANVAGSGEEDISFALQQQAANQNDTNRQHYMFATIKAVANNVVKRNSDTKNDTAISEIEGPRASATMISFGLRVLTGQDFSRYGKTGVSISGASGTYSTIDTTVYVENTSGAVTQLQIRITKKE